MSTSLMKYFDISLEMALALNPNFIKKDSKAYKDLEKYSNNKAFDASVYSLITSFNQNR